MHHLIDVTTCVDTIRDLQGKDWKVCQIPATLVAWSNGGTLVILEAGFRCRIHGSLDAALAAEQAYRAVVLESTRDLRGLAALVVAVIPLGLPGYIAVALASILTAVMVFIAPSGRPYRLRRPAYHTLLANGMSCRR